MRKLKVNDFFCGCGGMGVAFQNAGYEIAGAWDFDKYAVETYRRNVGDHVKRQDIREMTYKDVPKADVWAFGFPCQDLSVAGKQRGMILKCEDCGQELEINPEEYGNETICPNCSGNNFKAASRSGMFFEIMRLLEETERNNPDDMPAVIIAENVRGLRPYLPVLNIEYERHGYTAHIQMFNSKYWGVSQNRERYAVVGTRDKLGLHFSFPVEQHEFVPKLSSQIEKNVSEKYYLPDEKAQTIIAQALEKLEALGTVHACITPDRVNKRQNGPRAKAEEEPMFTLTAQDLHGVIILEDEQTEESVVADLAAETGLLHPDGVGKTLRVGGGGSTTRKHNYQHIIINPGGEITETQVLDCVINDRGFTNKPPQVSEIAPTLRAQDHGNQPKVIEVTPVSGGATKSNECCEHEPVRPRNERKCLFCGGDSTDINNQQGRGHKNNHDRGLEIELPLTVSVNKCGKNALKITDVSPCLTARDYKGFAGKKDMIAIIEERKEQ